MHAFERKPGTTTSGIRAEDHIEWKSGGIITAHPCWLFLRLRSCSGPWIPAFAGMTGNTPDALIRHSREGGNDGPRGASRNALFRHSREGGNPVTLLQPADDEGE